MNRRDGGASGEGLWMPSSPPVATTSHTASTPPTEELVLQGRPWLEVNATSVVTEEA